MRILIWMMVAATSRVASPLQGKALAALFALERASNLGMSRIILETDAMELKKALTTMNMDEVLREVYSCKLEVS
jgi:hypothetical protein